MASKSELQSAFDVVFESLQNSGIFPEESLMDPQGDIKFQLNNKTFYITIKEA